MASYPAGWTRGTTLQRSLEFGPDLENEPLKNFLVGWGGGGGGGGGGGVVVVVGWANGTPPNPIVFYRVRRENRRVTSKFLSSCLHGTRVPKYIE